MAPRPVETTKKKTAADTGLNTNDVLFGRGTGPRQHEGNRRFRSVVRETLHDYLQQGQAKHCCGSFPASLTTGTKSRLCRIVREKITRMHRLCRIVREKITRMHGRFLQKVTSVEVMTLSDQNLICVSQSEESKNDNGKGPCKTYYKLLDERQALDNIKQTFRFLLDQKFGRKKREQYVKVAETAAVDVEGSEGPSSASAVMPMGILSQGQTGQVRHLSTQNDVVARLPSECQTLPRPPPPSVVPLIRHNISTLEMLTPAEITLILQQRRQQPQLKEHESSLALLQWLRPGRDAGIALNSSFAGNSALQQQALALSMASSHGGFLGYGRITSRYILDTTQQVSRTFISAQVPRSTVPSPLTFQTTAHDKFSNEIKQCDDVPRYTERIARHH